MKVHIEEFNYSFLETKTKLCDSHKTEKRVNVCDSQLRQVIRSILNNQTECISICAIFTAVFGNVHKCNAKKWLRTFAHFCLGRMVLTSTIHCKLILVKSVCQYQNFQQISQRSGLQIWILH